MDEVIVQIEADVNPTEDSEKVKAAISKILGNAVFTEASAYRGSMLKAEAKGQDSLILFRNILRSDRIRDAARKLLYKSLRGNKIIFYVNKQVAFAGHVSFCQETAESPLGPIRVTIDSPFPQQLIEWLTEKTD